MTNVGEEEEVCRSIIETPDAGFILAGGDGADILLWKVNHLGVLQWIDRFMVPQWESSHCYSMEETTNGEFILGGTWYWNGVGSYDVYLLRIQGLEQASISLSPQSVPIIIPPSGGSFQFNVSLTNCGTISCTPEAWISVQLPSGSWYGPVLGPINLNLSAGGSLERLRTQNVPGGAPAGTYVYRGYIGDYPAKWDSSSFTFEKLGSGGLELGTSSWSNTGQSFDENDEAVIIHPS